MGNPVSWFRDERAALIRRRALKAVLLIAIVSLALLAAVYFLANASPTTFNSTSETGVTIASTTSVQSTAGGQVPVGVVYYLWYGNSSSETGGLGSPGWNSSSSPGGGAVVDEPAMGFYVSDSNSTFRRQVSEMESAGLTFAVVSWWGPSTTGEAGAINKATSDFFKFLRGTNSTFKAAVMIDAYGGGNFLNATTIEADYDYLFTHFVSPYSNWYFEWMGKPLLLTFNPVEPVSNDARFTSKEIGNYACKPVNTCPNHSLNQKLDWVWWQAPANFSEGQGGTDVNMTNDEGNPVISSDGEVTIVPRIDSYYNYESGHQSGYLRFDPSLQLGLYKYEWNYVLAHESEVRLVLIYSFNEFHERSAIEPVNTTSVVQNSLLDQTSSFIALFRGGY